MLFLSCWRKVDVDDHNVVDLYAPVCEGVDAVGHNVVELAGAKVNVDEHNVVDDISGEDCEKIILLILMFMFLLVQYLRQ